MALIGVFCTTHDESLPGQHSFASRHEPQYTGTVLKAHNTTIAKKLRPRIEFDSMSRRSHLKREEVGEGCRFLFWFFFRIARYVTYADTTWIRQRPEPSTARPRTSKPDSKLRTRGPSDECSYRGRRGSLLARSDQPEIQRTRAKMSWGTARSRRCNIAIIAGGGSGGQGRATRPNVIKEDDFARR